MLDIYICEDNPHELAQIRDYVQNCIAFFQWDLRLAVASTKAEDILDQQRQSNNCGLFFLDIELKGQTCTGFTLAQKIREVEPRCFIVFITSHLELSILTYEYKLEALDYIYKDNPEKVKGRIHDCIQNAYRKHIGGSEAYKKVFTAVMPNERQISVPYDDIICFRISPATHRVVLCGTHRHLEFAEQLNSIEARLNEDFFRCHRSVLIHLDHVKEVNYLGNTVTMIDGTEYPISIRKKNELKKLLKNKA